MSMAASRLLHIYDSYRRAPKANEGRGRGRCDARFKQHLRSRPSVGAWNRKGKGLAAAILHRCSSASPAVTMTCYPQDEIRCVCRGIRCVCVTVDLEKW